MTDDPEALTQFIFRCRERGVGVEAMLDCLQRVSDAPQDRVSAQRPLRPAAGAGGVHTGRDSRIAAGSTRSSNWPTGTARTRVQECTAPRAGCCGNGARRRLFARWIKLRCRIRLTASGSRWQSRCNRCRPRNRPRVLRRRMPLRSPLRPKETLPHNRRLTQPRNRPHPVRPRNRNRRRRGAASQDVLLHVHRLSAGRVHDRVRER